jgi:tetratricopeptide (TPR) repeat protein
LSQTALSFDDYLQLYNSSWNELGQYSNELLEYENRTLFSTWNLSLAQVENQDSHAAKLLRLLAYLDNQDLWYELFQAGAQDQPQWWSEVVHSRARFHWALSILHNYSLVEITQGSYSLHTCVHDWTLEYLNHTFDNHFCRLALHCVAQSVKWDTEAEYWTMNRRVLQHARRFEHTRLQASINWAEVAPEDLHRLGYLYAQSDMNSAAEKMYMRALLGKEKARGMEHTSTLDTVNNLGVLFADQGEMDKAEKMYIRALRGYEKARGAEHTSTLDTVNNLGQLYQNQGKIVEAEEMYMRALRGYEKAWGAGHTSTLDTFNNLGVLFTDQGKMAEAEEMYIRALRGKEKAWGAEHTSTLDTVNNLGLLYQNQGKMAEAEEMYVRALRG